MVSLRIPLFFLACLFGMVILLSCGDKEPPSNIDISNADGKSQISHRLAKTNEVKEQLQSVINAVKPASLLLADLTDAANKEVVTDDFTAANTQSVLEFIQRILKEVTEGFVQYLPDGSWVIERSLKLPALAPEFTCPTSKVLLVGKKEGDEEVLRLQVTGCVHAALPVELAYFGIGPDRKTTAQLHLDRVSNLFSQEKLVGDSCHVAVQGTTVEVNCKPISFHKAGIQVLVSPLYLLSDARGTTAHIALTVRRKDNGKFVVKSSLDVLPGEKLKIDVTTKGE